MSDLSPELGAWKVKLYSVIAMLESPNQCVITTYGYNDKIEIVAFLKTESYKHERWLWFEIIS